MDVLPREAVRLGLAAGSKEDAIRATGRVLEELGAVDIGYADAMLERERGMSTSVGDSLANILIEPDQAIQLRGATDADVVLAVLAPAIQATPQEPKETSHPDSTPARAG